MELKLSEGRRVSVAMASYNGAKYIGEQLVSILSQLPEDGEIVISDDGSTDETLSVIDEITRKNADADIRVIKGPGAGVKKNFENAIRNCRGDIIFLADQDDIWETGKVESVLKFFEKTRVTCVVHDCTVVDETGRVMLDSFFIHKNSGAGALKNIIANTYMGCCMAFRRELLPIVLPIPEDIEMHDQWIGILSDKYGISYFLQKKLLRYRRHGGNASDMKHYPFFYMLKKRAVLLKRFYQRRLHYSLTRKGLSSNIK